jgi:hypothetical protein
METTKRAVIITTKYRGVYFGYLESHNEERESCVLTNARMAIYWGTTKGVDQLAASGPTSTSKLGALAPKVWLPGLTSVSDCTEAAIAAWEAAK